jgi:hypothetical protein
MSSNNFVYIPGSDYSIATQALLKDLNTRATNLNQKYITKINEIQDILYSHQNDQKTIKDMLDNEMDNQKRLDEAYFSKYQTDQNSKINALFSDIREVQSKNRELYTQNEKFNAIKSFNNQKLVVSPIKNTNNYLININNNCLSVDRDNNFSLKKCDSNSISQSFLIKNINDNTSYRREYNTIPDMNTITQFPYSIVKSSVNNYCLVDAGNGVAVTNCKNLDNQKWIGLKNANTKCNV